MVPNASVQLFSLPRKDLIAQTTAGEDGAFRFPSVGPGEYILAPAAEGYLPPDPLLPLRVTVDDTNVQVEVPMTKAATIAGLAFDSSGEAMRGARVVLTPKVALAAQVDENGAYAIAAVPPGRYRVTIFPGAASTPFLPTRFPERLAIAAGDFRSGVDFLVDNAASTSVSGKVTGIPAAWKARSVSLTLLSDGLDEAPIAIVRSDSEGQFQFDKIPPGHYWLSAAGPTLRGGAFYSILGDDPRFALQQVVVGSEPVEDVDVPLQLGNTIDGLVKADQPDCLKGAAVMLETPDSVPVAVRPWSTVAAGGSFRIANVAPDRYRVIVERLKAGCYAMDSPAIPPGRDAHVEIRVSDHTGEINGRSRSVVAIAPLDASGDTRANEVQLARPDENGWFRFAQLPPGPYRLLKVSGERTSEYLDPLFWKEHEAESKALTLLPGLPAQVDLR